MFLKILQSSQENICVSLKLYDLTCNFIKKETLMQVFFCDFSYEISKNIIF